MPTLKDVLPKELPAEWQLVRHDRERAVYNQVVLEISTPQRPHFHKPQTLGCKELGCEPDAGGRITSRPGLCVVVHVPEKMNGREWMHVVVSVAPVAGNRHPSSYPLVNDLEDVRRLFLGAEKTATLLLKPEALRHQNDTPYHVHLWAELESRRAVRAE